jgi:serine/threonine-protein kinase
VLDDRYRVIEPIGEGAMGRVYRGERLKLGRTVAIKVLNEEIPNDSSRRRFDREATAMAKLEHPHCGTVLDVGVHSGRPYVVMEFVSGQNLKLLLDDGPLPIARAVEITKQVLSGLSHAHEHGLIHRDIKPANIVLSQKSGMGDFVKILDFGLVRFNQDMSNLTGGMVVGTPNYMAPEQIRGGQFDHRIDIYACGVMLFELLTGDKPFEADDPMAVCMRHLNEAPPRLADIAPGKAFGALEEVVAKALAKNPEERFASADEFSRALIAATAARPPAAPAARPKARSKRTVVLIGGAVIAAGTAAAIVLATRAQSTSTKEPAPQTASAPTRVTEPPVAKKGESVDDLLARAKQTAAAGRRDAALDLLLDARKSHPKDARVAYEASKIYFDKMWWADGLKQARAAITLDPTYKTDDELIKLVLKGFNTTKSYDWMLAKFLREDIGEAAKSYLEDTAKNHPNPIVRTRAQGELKRY